MSLQKSCFGIVKEKVAGRIFSKNSARNTDIKLARLDNDAGIIGAAML